jgi:hypothetical protein
MHHWHLAHLIEPGTRSAKKPFAAKSYHDQWKRRLTFELPYEITVVAWATAQS